MTEPRAHEVERETVEPRPRTEDPAMADFVLSMAKTMNRTGYYSTKHPEGQKAMLGLYDGFVNLMHERGHEFSFQISFAREHVGGEDVALYDGKSPIRMMRDILLEGAANTFVPKFVEYFHRQGLLSFTLKRDLVQEHFEVFIERMTQPADAAVKHPGEQLSRDLAAAGVRNVSVVFDEDRIQGLKGSIPWRAELALTRLRKDLRMIPMLANATVEEMRKIKSRLMDDILRGIQQASLLVALARHLGNALAGQEAVMSRDEAEEHLIAGIGPTVVANVAERMAKPWVDNKDEAESDDDRRCRLRLIKQLIQRLLMDTDKQAANALVVLYEEGYIDLDSLSPGARSLIRANALAAAALRSPERLFEEMRHTNEADPFGAVVRDLKLASETLIEMREWKTARYLIEMIWQYAKGRQTVPPGGAKKALGILAGLTGIELSTSLAEGIVPSEGPDEACMQIVKLLEAPGALGTLKLVLEQSDNTTLRQWATDEVTKRSFDDPALLLQLVGDTEAEWHVTKSLLTAVRKVADKDAFPVVAKLLDHKVPGVRAEALATMAEIAPEQAGRHIELALTDEDEDLRRAAALAAAVMTRPSEAATKRLLLILNNDREREGVRLQAVASLGAIAARPGAPKREEVLAALRAVVENKYGSRLHRFKRFASSRLPPPPYLLAAAVSALGAVGQMQDQALLTACLEDESIDVREAAKHAVGRLRAGSSA